MTSTASRAVRFFGTIHAKVGAVQSRVRRSATWLTPDRMPAVLATTSVTGLIVGWQIMDRVQKAAQLEHLEKFARDNPEYYDYRQRAVLRRHTMEVKPTSDHDHYYLTTATTTSAE